VRRTVLFIDVYMRIVIGGLWHWTKGAFDSSIIYCCLISFGWTASLLFLFYSDKALMVYISWKGLVGYLPSISALSLVDPSEEDYLLDITFHIRIGHEISTEKEVLAWKKAK
jgi:hypothetical protein